MEMKKATPNSKNVSLITVLTVIQLLMFVTSVNLDLPYSHGPILPLLKLSWELMINLKPNTIAKDVTLDVKLVKETVPLIFILEKLVPFASMDIS